jgi:uncharacterized RmlC-like cupin family protein
LNPRIALDHLAIGRNTLADYLPLTAVHPASFDPGTAQTPGSLRLAAISRDHGITTDLWGGTFLVEAGARTAIHHHGKQETVVYVLEGESLIRWGERGATEALVRAGDFLHVPAWTPHMEINPSKEHAFRWIVVRSTPDPIVVNLPDNYWG